MLLAMLIASVQAPVPAVPTSPAPEKKICRTIEDVSSRVRTKRDCRTRAEWRARNEAARALTPFPNGSLSSLRSGSN